MDLTDLISAILTIGPLVPPLLYVLTILLRVACHFAGVEIPALGRAFGTASLTALPSIAVGLFTYSYLDPNDSSTDGLLRLFLMLVICFFANMVMSTLFYRFLLGITYGQALTVWLIQAVSFVAFAALAGCILGAPIYLLFR